MKTLEILQRVAGNYNRLLQANVSGETIIVVSDVLLNLRDLAQKLQIQAESEQEAKATEEAARVAAASDGAKAKEDEGK